MISAGKMVADALYFNRVHRAQHWYTPSADTTVVEVKHVLRTGLRVQPISTTNTLPLTCTRADAMRKNAMKVSSLDHEKNMEEASKRDRLQQGHDDESEEDSDEESEESESKEESK
jgi:hypothetical protein